MGIQLRISSRKAFGKDTTEKSSLEIYWDLLMENKDKKVLIIIWEDICTTSSEWRSEEDALEWSDSANSLVKQVGYLLTQDEEYLTLACSYIPEMDLVGTTIRIPKSCIKSITEMK